MHIEDAMIRRRQGLTRARRRRATVRRAIHAYGRTRLLLVPRRYHNQAPLSVRHRCLESGDGSSCKSLLRYPYRNPRFHRGPGVVEGPETTDQRCSPR